MTPANVCATCEWHVDGQCRTSSEKENADAGSVPSSWSVAVAEKPIVSPTAHVSVDGGDCSVATGGVFGGGARVAGPWTLASQKLQP